MIQPIYQRMTPPPFSAGEALSYAGVSCPDQKDLLAVSDIYNQLADVFSYRVGYILLPFSASGDVCDFSLFSLVSADLATHLKGCKKALLFAATVGSNIDRAMEKAALLSPTRAVLLQGIGAERVEALCDAFCNEIKAENNWQLTERFSAGYGDLPLETQSVIFSVLSCDKYLGMGLSEHFLLSPSKSVTAFAGIY